MRLGSDDMLHVVSAIGAKTQVMVRMCTYVGFLCESVHELLVPRVFQYPFTTEVEYTVDGMFSAVFC